MNKRSPFVSAGVVILYAIAGTLACWIVALVVVVLFLNESDEAWWGFTCFAMFVPVVVLPLGILSAISRYHVLKMRLIAERSATDSENSAMSAPPPSRREGNRE
jgi:hypothetical protein